MLIKRLKIFGEKEKIIFNEIKRYFKDFGNANGKDKNFKIVNKLGAKDSLTLSKILPNHLTNNNLVNEEGKIKITEDIWNAMKKAGYFKDRRNKLPKNAEKAIESHNTKGKKKYLNAGDITLKEVNDYINTSKLKNRVYNTLTSQTDTVADNMIMDEYFEHMKKTKPDLYKKIIIDQDPHAKQLLVNQWKATGNAIKNRNLFNEEDLIRINKKASNSPINVSEKELEALKKDKGVINANVNFHESDYLSGPFQGYFRNKPIPEIIVNEHKDFYNELLNKGIDNRKTLIDNILKVEDIKKLLNETKEKYKVTDEEALGLISSNIRDKAATAEYYAGGGSPKTSVVFLPKEGKSAGSPSHEVGHAIEDAHSHHREFLDFDRTNNRLRFLENHAGPIQQLGNEGMASLRGISRYKGENKKQATKNLLDAYSTYVSSNGNDIIKGNW